MSLTRLSAAGVCLSAGLLAFATSPTYAAYPSPNRAVVLTSTAMAQQAITSTVALPGDWAFSVRVKRNVTTPAYLVVFSTNSFTDAFGIYAGYGAGGYTFFARDSSDRTNLAITLTDASQSPAGQYQLLTITYVAGVLRGFVDEVQVFSQAMPFYFDSPLSLSLGYRPGNPNFQGAVDFLTLTPAGSAALFDYQFNEITGNALNAGSVGGQLVPGAGQADLARELVTS